MSTLVSGTFAGPAGPIEYLLNLPTAGAKPVRTAVVCHPHPLGGGTMHTRLVFQTTAVLRGCGIPVLRFHFRGVGRSAGVHDRGRGEQADFQAAVAFLRARYPLPVIAAGFSFGAMVVARTLASGPWPEVERAVLLGLPADRVELPRVWQWQGPKLMISGAADEFARAESLQAYFFALAEPKRFFLVAGADHFLAGHGEEFARLLRANLDFERAAGQ